MKNTIKNRAAGRVDGAEPSRSGRTPDTCQRPLTPADPVRCPPTPSCSLAGVRGRVNLRVRVRERRGLVVLKLGKLGVGIRVGEVKCWGWDSCVWLCRWRFGQLWSNRLIGTLTRTSGSHAHVVSGQISQQTLYCLLEFGCRIFPVGGAMENLELSLLHLKNCFSPVVTRVPSLVDKGQS